MSIEVHLYHADRRRLREDVVASLVTAEDRERLTDTMAERRRSEYLAGRALLRYALVQQTGRDASAVRIEVGAGGKPICVGGPPISVSHSGDLVVCAIADAAVGVDVEVGSPRDLAAVAERYLTAAENAWLAGGDPQRFRMLWVLKEAYLKALGVGLSGGLASLECLIAPPGIVARTFDGSAPPSLHLLGSDEAHVGVAAVGAPGPIELVLHAFPGRAAPLRTIAATA